MPKRRVAEPQRREQQEEVVLGDAELDVLAVPAERPLLHRDDLLGAEDVLPVRAVEDATLVHPAAEIGGDRDVGRGGDDALGERALALAELVQDTAEGLLRGHAGAGAQRQRVRQRHGRRRVPARLAVEGGCRDERLQRLLVEAEASEARPLGAFVHVHRRAEVVHLLFGHDAGVIVLVAGERQAEALDGVSDEAVGHVGIDLAQRLQHRLHVVAGEVGHQVLQAVVVVAGEQRLHAGDVADVLGEPLAPGGAALEGERAVKLVGAVVDPLAERLPAGLGEGGLLAAAVLKDHHLPADGLEEVLDLLEQPVRDHTVEALAVIVDDPPEVADIVLPALQQRLEDIALVELGIAHDGDHAAGRAFLRRELVEAHVVLDHRREQRHPDAQPDRAGGDVHVVAVLGARGIALRPAEGAEAFQLGLGLVAEEVLDGVEHRARVGLHGDPVVRPEHVEVERRHQRRHRGAGGLMAAHLEPVPRRPQMVRVVDHPGRQPQHLALERVEASERLRRDGPVRSRAGSWVLPCARV